MSLGLRMKAWLKSLYIYSIYTVYIDIINNSIVKDKVLEIFLMVPSEQISEDIKLASCVAWWCQRSDLKLLEFG